MAKNTICLWYDKDAEAAARFYAETFPDSQVTAVHRAPSDYPSGKAGDVLTVEFTVLGIPCLGLNGGLKKANPDSTLSDRVWAIFHLAVLAFNEAFNKSRETDVQRYFDILESFPGLALKNSLDGLSVTDKILENLEGTQASTVKTKLAALKTEHDASSDNLNLTELQADIKAIRTLV
mgnify:CR=1 FL=1